MARLSAAKLEVSEEQQAELEAIIRKRSSPQQLVVRACIILLALAGVGVHETMRRLNIARTTVQIWRRRWREADQESVEERLGDRPRSGAPATYTPEQVRAIVAIACERPEDNAYLKEAVQNSEAVLESSAQEISADGAYYSEKNETYATEQDKEIHYTGFPGKPGRYDYERTEEGVVVTDRESGDTQLAEEHKPGRYRFRVDGKWRYITDKDLDTAACRRRTQDLPRELFNRRCNVEATIFQLCYHTNKKKLKYRGKFRVQLWAVCRAAWINMKRIASYEAEQAEAIA